MSAAVVGRFTVEQRESIRGALARAGMEAKKAVDGPGARRLLVDPSCVPPHLVLVDSAMAELGPLVVWIREQAHLFGVLIVAVVPDGSGGSFADAIALGCDDVVVQGDLGAITRRAATLHTYDPNARPPATQGRALLAHPGDSRRRTLGRVLRLAGFDVAFAQSTEELVAACLAEPPALLVLSDTMPDGASKTLSAVRAACGSAALPCVVVASQRGRSGRAPRTAVVLESAPPDHLLFVVNELLHPGLEEVRQSRRVIWDALCAYRPAGQLEPALGLTYNLSYEGLYVRTLDPPRRGASLWFELRPPHSGAAVHLRGNVVWVRQMDGRPGGITPPGFGVRIDERACPPADLEHYRESYEGLITERRLVA